MAGFNPRTLYAIFASLSLLNVLVAADAVSDLQTKGRAAIDASIAKSSTCTKDQIRIRRECTTRGDITASDKLAYIAAVQCITSSPSKLPPTQYPGAKTRFDDFVVIHMKNTLSIHGTGSFLSWHRYFTYAYENALRVECGYNGTQPYWDWGRYAASPETSPVFDGSETSMSGQGERVQHSSNGIKPAGNGGGCIASGPFKGMMVNLGPVAAADAPAPPRNPRTDGYGYNPRCIKRDISNYLTQLYATTPKIASLITNYKTIGPFQDAMQAPTGVHGAGHFTVAGDPGSDFYTSPGDPYFYLHHAMVDRTWYIWQSQDFANRQQVIAGGTSMMGGGRAQSLEDNIDLEVLNVDGKAYKIKELVSTVAGPFCYIYE
ncbi:Di-copper centre-containing protein [Stemphylium lycopersici]|uniref:Di-copper centre-containing protein n=1 Tax=Stemphylium lycopersici TaxID=183478 RepID=A0A364MUB3_STELY|nr:di-copper centre-containing [Stemphylium lycopersici]RAR00641.1 Di-copper centre-containing protein [Stemphylium lycopersici]RAR03005.1 Di-copper centre-containing protein [Stemphylium lycopersici]